MFKRVNSQMPFKSLCLFLVTISLIACKREYKESRFLLNTVVDVVVVGEREEAEEGIRSAFEEIEQLERLLSPYKDDSEISLINRFGASRVSSDTLELVEQAIRYGDITKGALDITIGPIMALWGFKTGNYRIPTDQEIAKGLSLVDYKKIIVNRAKSEIRLSMPGMSIDPGAIAVGFAVDKAINRLKEMGLRNALINAGGEIYALGNPPGRRAWRIGIRHPRLPNGIIGIAELKDRAVSTSGDYENFFELKGKRYCHIMNPKTGKPVQGIMSVTVFADNTTKADALSTAIFPMGAKKGMELIESLQDVECLIITGSSMDDIEILMSDGLKDKVQLLSTEYAH